MFSHRHAGFLVSAALLAGCLLSGPRPAPGSAAAPAPVPFAAFPRRALVISVHNYLYANPVSPGGRRPGGRNVRTLVDHLARGKGFRIPAAQVVHLSEEAVLPHAPLKGTIEATLRNFLAAARPQDRILVLFAGHAAEIDGRTYLVPIEGEWGNAATLIPLAWVYRQMRECKARQKVLVVDVCRHSPGRGRERPAEGAMPQTLERVLKAPPVGVQVWASCSAAQRSYEIEESSLFLDALDEVAELGVAGAVARPGDAFALAPMVEAVNQRLKTTLKKLDFPQTSFLSGQQQRDDGRKPDPKALPPAVVVEPAAGKRADARLVHDLLDALAVPSYKPSNALPLKPEGLPPFEAKILQKYVNDDAPAPLRQAVEKTQVLLRTVPRLQESFRVTPPEGAAERQFKQRLARRGRDMARTLRVLEEQLGELKKVAALRGRASRRWQATYDFMLARLQRQIAYVYEYSSMLGQLRRELPPRDPGVQGGWRLAAQEKLQGDFEGRKLAKAAQKLLARLIEEHPGTPYAILARREGLTALGLEWVPER